MAESTCRHRPVVPRSLVASDGVTTRSDGATDDEFWRRPAQPEGPATTPHATDDPPPSYPGPPTPGPPATSWRPSVFVQPPPPRHLPTQDLARLESDERSARTLTYGIGMIAGAVLLVVVCLLCSRIVF